MSDECCSTCKHWSYNRWAEEKYGMGVGVCVPANQETFCGHSCVLYEEEIGGADHEH